MTFAEQETDSGNDLFQNGSYTQYNLALQTIEGDEADLVGDSSSGSDDPFDIAVHQDTSADDTDHGSLAKLLGGLGLHTLGDGLFS